MAKGSENPFPSVMFVEQAVDVAAPAAGRWRVFLKADGVYLIDDAGVVTGPLETDAGAQARVDAHGADTTGVHGIADTGALLTDSDIGTQVQAWDADLDTLAAAGNSAVLAATTEAFTTADGTKLDGIEAGAEVNTVDSVDGQTGAVVLSDTYAPLGDYVPQFFPMTVNLHGIRGTDMLSMGNRGVYYRVRDGGTISKIGLHVGTSSGNISVAAYSNSGSGRSAAPGAQLGTSGAVACPTAGYAEVSLGGSLDVEAGDWLFLSADNATATFLGVLAGIAGSLIGSGMTYQQTAGHHPAPSPAPAVGVGIFAIAGQNIVLIGVP